MPDLKIAIYSAWVIGLVFWAVASVASKRTERKQSQASELGQGAVAGAGFVLLFNRQIHLGPLDSRLIPEIPGIGYLGFALTVLGLAGMAWSRVALGRNWSATVTIKKDHDLVISGPYAFVRHPLYSGVLLAMFGTALFFADVRSFLALSLTFAGWWLKSQTEERFMLEQFGAQYQVYQQRVKAFIPYVL